MALAENAKEAGWRLLKWGTCGLMFTAVPFVFSYWDLSHHFHNRLWPYQLWSHGELSLVALAIGADGFGEAIFRKVRGHPISHRSAGACAIMAVVSCFIFGEVQLLSPDAIPDIKDYSRAQMVVCAIVIGCTAIAKAFAEN